MFRQSVSLPFRSFCLLLSLLALHGWAHAAENEAVTKLEIGNPIERQFAAGDIHSYQLDLLLNQYAEVVVDQRGIDLAIWAYDPKGQKLVEADAFRAGDQESIIFVGEIVGPYRLEIRSSSPKAPPGRYEIKIKELRTATEKDKYTVTGSRIVAAASQLERQGSADSFRQAIAKYHEVLPIWKLAGLRLWEATVLYLIANDYVFPGEKQKALESATSAVEVAQAAAKEADNEERTFAVKVEANALDVMS